MTDNILVKDSTGANKTMRTTDSSGVHIPHHVVSIDGTPLGAAKPMPISDNGGSITVDGTVAISSITPGTGGTNLGSAVDSAAGATDVGVAALAVRDDVLATLTPIDGDYTYLRVTSQGRLWVSAAIDSALPAGTNAIGKLAANSGVDIGDVDVISVTPGTGANNLGKLVNGVAGAADVGVAILGIRDDALATLSPADGDYGRFRMDSIGRLWSNSYVNNGYDAVDDMFKVKSVQKKFRDSFPGTSLDAAKWDSAIGTGGSIAVSGGTVTLGSGTTASAETSILSKEKFTVPFRVSASFTLSQRIANQTFIIEAVSVNPITGVPDGLHTAAIVFDGTTATSAKYRVQNNGLTALDSGASTFPTSASGSTYEIEPFADECWFHGGILDSNSGRANSYRRHQQIPDPNAVYKIRLRWVNGSTAPASSSNAVVQFVACQDYAELTAEITAGRGQSVAGQGVGVNVITMPTITANAVAQNNVYYNESTTAQAASATLTGTSRDTGVAAAAAHRYSAFNAFAFADQAGTMRIECSNDNTTWRRMTTDTPVAANTPVILSVPIMTRYHRVVYVNGSTVQGAFMLNTSYTAA